MLLPGAAPNRGPAQSILPFPAPVNPVPRAGRAPDDNASRSGSSNRPRRISRALEQLAEGLDRGRRLVLEIVNPAGESVGHLLDVARVNKSRKGERLFPEEIDHVLEIIDALLARHLVFFERILLVLELALEGPDARSGPRIPLLASSPLRRRKRSDRETGANHRCR